MAKTNYKPFDQVGVVYTDGLGGQGATSPNNPTSKYRETTPTPAAFPKQDQGISPPGITYKGVTKFSGKYRYNQTGQLRTDEQSYPSTEIRRVLPDTK